MIGDWIYQLTPRDSQLPAIEPFVRYQAITASALSGVSVEFVFPADKVAILSHVFMRCRPAATVSVDSANVVVRPHANATQSHVLVDLFTAAGERRSASFGGGWLVLGWSATIFANCIYSVGNSGNNFEVSIAGYLLPRGNVQSANPLPTPLLVA